MSALNIRFDSPVAKSLAFYSGHMTFQGAGPGNCHGFGYLPKDGTYFQQFSLETDKNGAGKGKNRTKLTK